MGQRHQAYLIARVIPQGSNQPHYRCIGAIHHQWCYGSLPLRATCRFLDLIKQKEHGEIILEEIKALNGQYGSHLRKAPVIPSVPCPFTSFLFNTAWSVDLSPSQDEPLLSMAHDLHAGMRMREGDNNDGVTVIDVSDPESPSYCYSFLGGAEPISAEMYLRRYYPLGSEESQEGLVFARALDDIPLVPIQHLAEAWPTEFRAREKDESARVDNESVNDMTPNIVPPLADLVLRPALEHLLRNDDEDGLLRLLLPHKIDQILEILRAQHPMPKSGVFLLSNIFKAIKDRKVLDLSGFSLSTHQVLSLVPVDAIVEGINLSHNHAVGVDAIEQLLTRYQSLRRLVLLDTRIPEEDIVTLLKDKPEVFYHVEAIVHPVFMKPKTEDSIPDAYTHLSFTTNYDPSTPTSIGLPFLNPTQVLQTLLNYTRMLSKASEKGAAILTLSSMGMYAPSVALAAYPSESLKAGRKWGERIVPYIPRLRRFMDSITSCHGWKLLWSSSFSNIRYAFLRVNAEAMSEYLEEYKSLGERGKKVSLNPITNEEYNEKTKQLGESFKNCLFQVYDVRGFFEQLELEGRPAPPQDELERLYNEFAALENRDGLLRLLNQEEAHGYVTTPWAMCFM
ncbi:hypothetical protein BDN72DRAFT_819442 [Pluteus cervinus]|uniref:Uncharacterized protein n=1 Tax=Pluteus cervinus TaxID=181527 RepID=A0ACD3AXD9_9AGAR|nr:hypothetical protein BDN72DRAFT_819442 [Pluteus cervinus]